MVRFRRFAIPIACPEKKKNNNKDSTEIRKTIKDSNVLESFNNRSTFTKFSESYSKIAVQVCLARNPLSSDNQFVHLLSVNTI